MAGVDLVAGHAELWYLEKPGLKSTKMAAKIGSCNPAADFI